MPGLVKVIVLDREGLRDFRDEKVIFLDDLYEMGRKAAQSRPGLFEEEIAKARPDDVRDADLHLGHDRQAERAQ